MIQGDNLSLKEAKKILVNTKWESPKVSFKELDKQNKVNIMDEYVMEIIKGCPMLVDQNILELNEIGDTEALKMILNQVNYIVSRNQEMRWKEIIC